MVCGTDGSRLIRHDRERRVSALRAGLLALVAAVGTVVLLLAGSAAAPQPLGWLDSELGERNVFAPLTRQVSERTRVELGRDGGFRLERGGGTVSLSTLGLEGDWDRHSGGVSRPTEFGRETITANEVRTELYLTVNERQGVRTWKWKLDTNLRPSLLPNGAVALTGGRLPVEIAPFAIYGRNRADITPAGASWKLDRAGSGWTLSARFDDAGLSLPYVIDPGIADSAPAPYRERVMADNDGAGTDKEPIGYWRLGETSGPTATNQVSGGSNGTHASVGTGTVATLNQAALINGSDPSAHYNGPAGTSTANGSITRVGSLTTPKTIAVWAAWSSSDNAGSRPLFGNRGTGASPATSSTLLAVNGGQVRVFHQGGTNTSFSSPASSYGDGNPHHIVWTWDGDGTASSSGTQRLYIDGAEVINNVRALTTTALATSPAAIGGDEAGTDTFFRGRIDEVAVWDVPLTATEIAAHYAAGRDFGLTITESTSSQYARVLPTPTSTYNGTNASQRPTLYFNPATATGASFTVTSNASDAEDSISSVDFAAVTGANDPPADTTSTYDGVYTWASPPGSSQDVNVTITNNSAGDKETSVGIFKVQPDSTAPNGSAALSVNGVAATSGAGSTGYDSNGDFTVGTRTDYAEAASATASGLLSSTLIRTEAPYTSADTCGTFGSPTADLGAAPVTQSGLVTKCYRYTLTGTDNVGNTASIVTTIKNDNSAPDAFSPSISESDAQSFVDGTRIFIRTNTGSDGGSFTVTAAPTDADTGIEKVVFPSILGGGGEDFTSAYSSDYTWTTSSTDASGNVVAFNKATGQTASGINVTVDNTAPVDGSLVASNLSLAPYDDNGAFTITRTDYTEAASTTASGLVSSVLTREDASLSGDACGTYGAPVAQPAGNVTASGLATGCYRYTLTGTDNVGNTASVSVEIKVDASAPAAFTPTITETDADSHAAGARVFIRTNTGANGGTFTVAAAPTDPHSGIQKVSFPAILGGGGDDVTSSYSADYTWATTDGAANGDVTAYNKSNLTTASAIDVAVDNTAPTGGGLVAGGLSLAPYDGDGGFTITRTDYTETASTTASGLASSMLTREDASLSGEACGTYGAPVAQPAGSVTASGLATGCYRYTLTGTDNVGNTASVSVEIKVDTSAPAAFTPTITESDAKSFVAGTRIFVRTNGGSGGSFTVTAAPADGESGIQKVQFPSILGGGGFDNDSPYSDSYSWTTSTTDASGDVTAYNKADLTTTSGISVTVDNTGPTGGAITVNGGAEWNNTGTFPINTRTAFTETPSGTQSGISASDGVLVRETATLTGTSCGTFGSATTIVGQPTQDSGAGIANGNCYRYTLTGTDNVGNTSSVSFTVKVDTTAPTVTIDSGPAAASTTGSTSATFTFSSNESAAFQCKLDDGSFGACTGSGTHSLTGLSHGSHTFTVQATDSAGNTASVARTWNVDTVGPAVSGATVSGTTLTVSFNEALGANTPEGDAFKLSRNGTDVFGTGTGSVSGSSVTVTIATSIPAGQTGWTLAYTAADAGTAPLEDAHGNDAPSFTGQTVNSGTDTTPPDTSITSGPSGSVSSTSAEFGFTSTEGGSTFECKIDAGSFAACTSPQTYTGLAAGSHTFEVRATDPASNVDASPASRTWTIDTTAPTASIDSGPAESSSTTSTSAEFGFSSNEGGSSFACQIDGGGFSACTSPKTYTGLATGSHTFQVRATDAAGNNSPIVSRTWTITAPVGPPPPPPAGDAAPKLASSTPADGVTVSSISSLTLTASEAVTWSSVTVTHENGTVTALAGAASATSITRAFGPSSEGLHTVRATLSDGVNSAVTVTTHFTVWVGSPGEDAPPSEVNAGGSESAEISASNRVASVSVPAGATTDAIVLQIDPSPTTSAGNGFSIGTDTVEVTARRASDGTPITTFAQPLDIHFPNAPADAVPLRSQDGGTFQPITLMFSPELPSTWQDGYFRDASGTVHILTRHLTFFTLFRDTAGPTAPRSLVGVVGGDGLTLRWEPASDNAGVTNYVLLVDGVFAQLFGGQTYEAKLGAFNAGDTRLFTIQARDAAGHYGPASAAVRGVPNLTGMTLEQATAALAARGFTLGAVTGTSGAVIAQDPAAPGAATVPSAVNVTLGTATGQAKLVLKVASAKRISLASRRWIGVRVTVSARSTVSGVLVSSSGRVIERYADRQVPSGASVLRFPVPRAKVTRPDRYRLQLRATSSGQSVARTARVQIVPGVLQARFTPVRKPIGVAIIDGSIKGLNLGSSFRVNYVVPSLAFDVIGLHPAFIEAAVIDVSVVERGLIRSLRQVFPELRILAIAPTSTAAAEARADGASIALVKPVSAARVSALLRRSLGR